jgi:hypothetical protein
LRGLGEVSKVICRRLSWSLRDMTPEGDHKTAHQVFSIIQERLSLLWFDK